MKSLNNVGAERLGDALGESIDDGAKLSIISSYFTVFAYGELKEELSKIDEVRFLFSEPVSVTLRIPDTLRDAAKEEAALRGMSFSAFVRTCMIEELAKKGA